MKPESPKITSCEQEKNDKFRISQIEAEIISLQEKLRIASDELAGLKNASPSSDTQYFEQERMEEIQNKPLRTNSLNPALFIINFEGIIQNTNDAAIQLFGYAIEELNGMDIRQLLIQFRAADNNLSQNKMESAVSHSVARRKDNSSFEVKYSTSSIKMTTSVNSIAIIVENSENISQGEREMALLINNTDEAFVLIDSNYSIISFNTQSTTWYQEYKGLNISKGKSIFDYALHPSKEQLRNLLDQVILGFEITKIIPIPVKGGNVKYFQLKYSPARESNGDIIGVFMTGVDITEKKIAEDQLKVINNNLPGGVFRFSLSSDGKDKIIYMSEGSRSLWNLDPEVVMENNQLIWDLFFPEDLAAVKNSFKRSANTLEKWTAEWRVRLHDGSIQWQRGIGTPQRMMDGSTLWDSLIINITAEKQAEEIIINKERKYRTLVENASDAIAILDLSGRPSYVSPSIERVLGYTEQEAMQIDLFEILHPEDRTATEQRIRISLENPGIPVAGHTGRVMHRDGSYRWIEATLTNMLHDPNINGIVDNIRDITERIRNENELRELKSNFELLLQSTYEGLYGIDLSGNCIFINNAAATLLGHDPSFCIGKNMHSLIHHSKKDGSPYPDSECPLFEANRNGTRTNVEDELFWKSDGTPIEIRFSTNPIIDRNGNLKGSVITFSDITESKQSAFKMRMLINNTEESFVLTDKNLKILSFNVQFEKLYKNYFGIDIKLGKSIIEYAQPERREIVKKLYQKVLSGATEYTEIKVADKDDRIKDFSINYKPAINKENEIIGAFVTCTDITEKKKYLAKLKEEEEKLLTAQKIAHLGYWQLNLIDFSLYWSDELYNIWGVEKGTYIPSYENLMNSVHPDDRHYFAKDQESSFEDGNEFEHRIILPDGTIKWIHERGKYKFDKSGIPIIFEGTAQDITESRLAKGKLMVSEARHRGIVESQTNYVIRTDLEGNYTFCNEKFKDDFAWVHEGDHIIGQNGLHSVMDYHHSKLLETVEHCFANLNQVFQVELDKPKSDGSIITSLWDFICLTDANGQPSEIQCVGIDISARKNAEDALIESNKRYEYVSKATFDAIWDWDVNTNKIIWGEAFYSIFGYETDGKEMDISSWYSRIHQDDLERVKIGIESVLSATADNWEDQYRYLKADGNYAYVFDRALILRDDSGKAFRMVGAMQDVTEKKNLQKLLEKTNSLARIGSWETDFKTGKTYLSDITRKIYELDEPIDFEFTDLLQFYKEGYSRDKLQEVGADAILNGVSFDVELVVVTAKGNELWVRLIGDVELENGKTSKLFGSIQDINATKKAQIAALETLSEKNQILESIDDAFIALDTGWVVHYWNKEAEKLLGKSREEMIGQYIWENYSDAIDTDFYKYYHEAVNDGRPRHFESFYSSVNRWFEVSAYPSATGLSVYFKDISDRKKTELELINLNEKLLKQARDLSISNSELEQFAYVASHDLQEPLRMVTGFLSQLEKKYQEKLDDTAKKYIHFAVDGARRMRQIILDLLDYSRVGRLEESLERIDIGSIVKEIQILFRVQIDELKATFEYTNLPIINSYKTPVRQVLQNLISNALKYHAKERAPLIKIKCVDCIDHWQFSVEDNGIGIEPEYFDRIFILFQRLHDRSQYSGTGIGLAITRKIVENLGGEINVKSEENKGTVFTFTIAKI